MDKTKPIRDPIHNYIDLTPIEQHIIDGPDFQRLRFILQNACAYLTYPSNTHNRFLHSLGTMHLSGEILIRALQNAHTATLDGFLIAAKKTVEYYSRNLRIEGETLKKGWSKLLGDAGRFNHRPIRGERKCISEQDLCHINLLWQVVRVVGLVHDLGHLPMSHLAEDTVEDVLANGGEYAKPLQEEQAAQKKRLLLIAQQDVGEEAARNLAQYKLHEVLGFELFDKIYPDHNSDPEIDAVQRLVNALARVVLLLEQSYTRNIDPQTREYNYEVLRCLHSIVSGELDADRLDYCQRDPKESGLEFGAFDLQRILDSLVLIAEEGAFYILPTVKALSAIESFYHQRYLLYKYLLYHHNVARMDGIFQHIFRCLLLAALNNPDYRHLHDLTDRMEVWDERAGEGYRFPPRSRLAYYDDAWLRTLVTESFIILSKLNQDELSNEECDLLLLLDTFLNRRTQNLYSMWKRDADYFGDIEGLCGSLPAEGTAQETDARKREVVHDLGKMMGKGVTTRVVTEKIIARLKEKGVILILRNLVPKVIGLGEESLRVVSGYDKLELAQVSPYARSLREVAKESPSIHISFLAPRIKANLNLQAACRDIVIEELRQYLERNYASTSTEEQ